MAPDTGSSQISTPAHHRRMTEKWPPRGTISMMDLTWQRPAGRVSAPGKQGARCSRRRRRAERRRTGRRRRGRPTRLEDRRHAPVRGGGTTGKKVVELRGRMLCRCGSRLRRVLSGAAVHTGKVCGQGVAGAKSACDERLNHPGSRGGDAQLNARRRGGGRPWQAGSVAGRTFTGSLRKHVGASLPSAWACSACLRAVRMCMR